MDTEFGETFVYAVNSDTDCKRINCWADNSRSRTEQHGCSSNRWIKTGGNHCCRYQTVKRERFFRKPESRTADWKQKHDEGYQRPFPPLKILYQLGDTGMKRAGFRYNS